MQPILAILRHKPIKLVLKIVPLLLNPVHMVLNLLATLWLVSLPMLLLTVSTAILCNAALPTIFKLGSISLNGTALGAVAWFCTHHCTGRWPRNTPVEMRRIKNLNWLNNDHGTKARPKWRQRSFVGEQLHAHRFRRKLLFCS